MKKREDEVLEYQKDYNVQDEDNGYKSWRRSSIEAVFRRKKSKKKALLKIINLKWNFREENAKKQI